MRRRAGELGASVGRCALCEYKKMRSGRWLLIWTNAFTFSRALRLTDAEWEWSGVGRTRWMKNDRRIRPAAMSSSLQRGISLLIPAAALNALHCFRVLKHRVALCWILSYWQQRNASAFCRKVTLRQLIIASRKSLSNVTSDVFSFMLLLKWIKSWVSHKIVDAVLV